MSEVPGSRCKRYTGTMGTRSGTIDSFPGCDRVGGGDGVPVTIRQEDVLVCVRVRPARRDAVEAAAAVAPIPPRGRWSSENRRGTTFERVEQRWHIPHGSSTVRVRFPVAEDCDGHCGSRQPARARSVQLGKPRSSALKQDVGKALAVCVCDHGQQSGEVLCVGTALCQQGSVLPGEAYHRVRDRQIVHGDVRDREGLLVDSLTGGVHSLHRAVPRVAFATAHALLCIILHRVLYDRRNFERRRRLVVRHPSEHALDVVDPGDSPAPRLCSPRRLPHLQREREEQSGAPRFLLAFSLPAHDIRPPRYTQHRVVKRRFSFWAAAAELRRAVCRARTRQRALARPDGDGLGEQQRSIVCAVHAICASNSRCALPLMTSGSSDSGSAIGSSGPSSSSLNFVSFLDVLRVVRNTL
eukprot:5092915-Prymnesium_polylepis.1